jgi:hypothetical protein
MIYIKRLFVFLVVTVVNFTFLSCIILILTFPALLSVLITFFLLLLLVYIPIKISRRYTAKAISYKSEMPSIAGSPSIGKSSIYKKIPNVLFSKTKVNYYQNFPIISENALDSLPEIIKVSCEPPLCYGNIGCYGSGCTLKFKVQFKTLAETYGKHTIMIGLRSGKLGLNLASAEGHVTKPELTIPSKIELVVKDRKHDKIRYKERYYKDAFPQIIIGGTVRQPYWLFQSFKGNLFQGVSEDLVCKIKPDTNKNCQLKYFFTIWQKSWAYTFNVDQKLSKSKRIFIELTLKEICTKRIAMLSNIASTKLHNTLSRGEWKFLAKKVDLDKHKEMTHILERIEKAESNNTRLLLEASQLSKKDFVSGILEYPEEEQKEIIIAILQNMTKEFQLETLKNWEYLSEISRAEALEVMYRTL